MCNYTQYRQIPVPERLIEELDLVFDLRRKRSKKELLIPLWSISRATAWRRIKTVMERANIFGPCATSKGLRHSFGIALIEAQLGDRFLSFCLKNLNQNRGEV